ncbi:MAG TPA: GFA family protein [Gammaproteobacteria bacterium]
MECREAGNASRARSLRRGECNCGAVAFEPTADPSGVFVCHCSICRRFTGSNGVAVVVVANDAFRWLRGEEHIATWKKPDGDWQAWFCRMCRSAPPKRTGMVEVLPARNGFRDGDQNRALKLTK